MQKHFLFILSLLMVGIVFPVQAQINEAKKEMSLYNYSKAIEILLKADLKKDNKRGFEAASLLAECYRKQNDVPKSLDWYKKTIELGSTDASDYFYYAQALRSSGNYKPAKSMFLKSDSLLPADHLAKIYATYCDSAILWQSQAPRYTIRNLEELNTPQSEFGLVIYKNEILFSSDRIMENEKERYGWTGNNFLRIYSSIPNDPGDFSKGFKKPERFDEFGSSDGHDGPISFNKSFSEVFINRSLLNNDKGKKETNRIRTHLLKIFTGKWQNGKWGTPISFFLNNENYSVGHPALTARGDTLIFASDMPGGFGGTDLYICTRKDDQWDTPRNIGSQINSSGNEMFPFIATNGDLCYSSDGLPGFGGLDIFIAKKVKSSWGQPVNLGLPVNSAADDFSFSFSKEDQSGFFSSNRPGGKGSDDLYFFNQLIPSLPPPLSFVSGCVKDKTTKKPIPLSWVFLLNEKTEEVLIIRTDTTGCFKTPVIKGVAYVVKGMQTGYRHDCLTFGFDISEQQTQLNTPRDLLLEKLETGKVYSLKNIYYDFDLWNIRADAKPSLDELISIMKENPVTVELASHTDCRGSVDYNITLSQKRAESAVAYIVQKGIDNSKIIAKGYGKSRLINRCNCEDGNRCSEAEHQANRRTEFTILNYTSPVKDQDFDLTRYLSGMILKSSELPKQFFDRCK